MKVLTWQARSDKNVTLVKLAELTGSNSTLTRATYQATQTTVHCQKRNITTF